MTATDTIRSGSSSQRLDVLPLDTVTTNFAVLLEVALVFATVRQLADDSHRLTRPDAVRLGPTIADLVALMLGSMLDAWPDRSQAVLLSQIQSFIEDRLNDPTLAPSLIAAHHIAPRTLNRIFARHGLTVAGWIRHRRGCTTSAAGIGEAACIDGRRGVAVRNGSFEVDVLDYASAPPDVAVERRLAAAVLIGLAG